jgi:hypothetical protein
MAKFQLQIENLNAKIADLDAQKAQLQKQLDYFLAEQQRDNQEQKEKLEFLALYNASLKR